MLTRRLKPGAAFAAQALATSAAKAELEAYLPSLVPKLYRYSYDPNPRVAQSMAGILAVLVSLQTALDKYWEPIVAYVRCLSWLMVMSWLTRLRTASCSKEWDRDCGECEKDAPWRSVTLCRAARWRCSRLISSRCST